EVAAEDDLVHAFPMEGGLRVAPVVHFVLAGIAVESGANLRSGREVGLQNPMVFESAAAFVRESGEIDRELRKLETRTEKQGLNYRRYHAERLAKRKPIFNYHVYL
ncbi:MAG: hypothetical protein WCG92_24950, partial [Hyphomicrobiales bacterium]